MSKGFWISSVALLMLSVPAAGADDAGEGPEPTGPVQVEVGAAAIGVADGESPITVHVQTGEGPGHTIHVQTLTQGGQPTGPDGAQVIGVPDAPMQPITPGEYWLGVACYPAGGALSAQLGLPEGQGLVVQRVVPESPAAKAEIKQHDVLLEVGQRPLKNGRDLIDAVQAAEGKQISVKLIRGAKPKQVAVTPVKQPEEARPRGTWERPGEEALQAYKRLLEGFHLPGAEDARQRALKHLERLRPGEVFRGPMRWQIFGPGAIVPPDAWPRRPLPGNMSITINKQGDQPAKITVKQGDQKWEVTEEELDKLPEKVRTHVERMLGRVTGGPPGHHLDGFDSIPDQTAPGAAGVRPEGPPQGLLDKRLEEMNRRIERLQKSIEDMRPKRPRLRKAPEEKATSL